MHKIQQHALKQLIMNPVRRFSGLKPDEVESNLFMYHLKQLIKENLVQKRADGLYCLTERGKAYADSLSLESFQPRLQPRIVTLLMIKNEAGEYLLYRRMRQPLINMVGFPYGKVHLGETIAQAAARELSEKTGLEATLVHRGDGYITMIQGTEPISQILFHLFLGSNPTGQLTQSDVGEAFWADPSQVPGWELLPSVMDLVDQLNSSDRLFFLERTYQLEAVTS